MRPSVPVNENDTLTFTEDGRTALRMERPIGHPPGRVWEALTRPELTAQWFPCEISAEPRAGEPVTFTFPGGEAPPMAGTVIEAEKPWVFAYTWGGDRFHWSVRPDRSLGDSRERARHSLLTLVHTFDDHYGAASFASGWHLCVDAMAQLLDGGPVRRGDDRDGALHEAYVAQFGLGAVTVEESGAGPALRFERQLVRPARMVWALLTEGRDPAVGETAPAAFTTGNGSTGKITEVRAPELLEYEVSQEGHVRWELTTGTGHGARLVLTVTETPGDDEAVAAAGAAWYPVIEDLAARCAATPQ
ncbi:SRPBCC family protein [Streptomyces tsukubensis]|nr:SRPBCC family protein [Streptomyces tsukubensis]